MNKIIGKTLEGLSLEIYGFCKFSDVGEPLPTRNRDKIPQNAKTIISLLFPYRIEHKGRRNLSLYCTGLDYHDIVIKKLELACKKLKEIFPQNSFVPFCDNSPIREVVAAYKSALGFLGKNGLIIHPKFGSYCFIGEIVTDLELDEYSSPLGFCIGCGMCAQKCVGGALSKDKNRDVFVLEREKCLSFITQKKGELSSEQKKAMQKGGLVWGCDGCSLACPMNEGAQYSSIAEFYQSPLPYLTEKTVSEAAERSYGYKGEKILLRNLGIIGGDDGNNN